MLLKISAKQTECFRLEQMTAIKFLAAEKCKPRKIYKTMCDLYREACFN